MTRALVWGAMCCVSWPTAGAVTFTVTVRILEMLNV
jgi:hypothetical protein